MAKAYRINRNSGYDTMTDPYKELLKSSIELKDVNINWLNRNDHRYDPPKPMIWLEVLGLFETLHIKQVSLDCLIRSWGMTND